MLLLAGCGSTAPAPTLVPTPEITEAPIPTVAPSQLPAGQGWTPQLIYLDMEPDGSGGTQLDAGLLLEWGGPGLGLEPPVAAQLVSQSGERIDVEADLQAAVPTWIAPGFGISAEVLGSFPGRVVAPKLELTSADEVPFHDASFDLTIAKPLTVPLPPKAGDGTLMAPGIGSITPGPIAIAHSTGDHPTILAQHGTHVVEYGGDSDYWNVWVGLSLSSSGSIPVDPDQFEFELFDDTWDVDSVDDMVTSALGGGGSTSVDAEFMKSSQPAGLRLMLLAPPASGGPSPTPGSYGTYGYVIGAPAAWSVAAYDAPDIARGTQLFQSLTAEVDRYQEQCNASPSGFGDGSKIGESLVTAAAPLGDGTHAIVDSVDTMLSSSGATLPAVNAEYSLVASGDTWQVQQRTDPTSLTAIGC